MKSATQLSTNGAGSEGRFLGCIQGERGAARGRGVGCGWSDEHSSSGQKSLSKKVRARSRVQVSQDRWLTVSFWQR